MSNSPRGNALLIFHIGISGTRRNPSFPRTGYINIIESSFYHDYTNTRSAETTRIEPSRIFPPANQNVAQRYRNMQEVIRSQYLYQKGLLNEVILSILRDAGHVR